MSYGADAEDNWRLPAAMSAASSKAISQPTCRSCGRPSSSSSINLQDSKALRIDIPPKLLALTDEVIE